VLQAMIGFGIFNVA